MRRIRVLDLFSGAGGLSQGFHQGSGRYRVAAAVEIDPAAAASYRATFPDVPVFARPIQDWLAADPMPERVDVVIGGPPCQGFSTLGKQDVEDTRNALWRHYAEAVARVEPSYFVIENVAAFFKSPQFGKLNEALESGPLSDYRIEPFVLNAADYGAGQVRRRAVVLGRRKHLAPLGAPLTSPAPAPTVGSLFSGVPHRPDMDTYFAETTTRFAGRTLPGPFSPRQLHVGRTYSARSLERFAHVPLGGNRFDLPDDLLPGCWRRHTSGTADVMGRLHLDRPSVTIRTEFFKPEKGRYLHPTQDRAITHYEAALLQGFPETHRFVGSKTAIARQIGNAVPIPLGAAIGRHLAERF